MATKDGPRHFVFPRTANLLLPGIVVVLIGAPMYVATLAPLVGSPTTLNVGFRPNQPVPYSHAIHVGQLGMDCRYCHTTVENSDFAAIPPTATCMNCHHAIRSDSPLVAPIRESYETGMPIEWNKVHDLPDYVYFSHKVHLAGGVSCVECHGRVDAMDDKGVYTVANLSMSWCLDCHRNPEARLRPREEVTNLSWTPPNGMTQAEYARHLDLMKLHNIPDSRLLTDCSTCHR